MRGTLLLISASMLSIVWGLILIGETGWTAKAGGVALILAPIAVSVVLFAILWKGRHDI